MKKDKEKTAQEKLEKIKRTICESKEELLKCKGECHELIKEVERLRHWEEILEDLNKIEKLVDEKEKWE